tara:strand:- start:189 stop:362 length:174 start_codon:yes stop_codon:yes gene_type:complete
MKSDKPTLVTMKFKPQEVLWLKAALDNTTIKGEDSLVFADLYKKITSKTDQIKPDGL